MRRSRRRWRICSLWVFVGIMELKNQKIASVEAGMSDLIVVGDYELLEQQKEGYRNNRGSEA